MSGIKLARNKRKGIPGMRSKMCRQKWENMPFSQDYKKASLIKAEIPYSGRVRS